MKIRGNDIILFVKISGEWKTLAYGTSCELDINVATLGIAPDGKCERSVVKRISWSGSSAHLQSDTVSAVDVFQLLQQSEEQRIMIGSVEESAENRDYTRYLPDGRFGLKGNAHIDRMTVTAGRDSKATMSIGFTGTGPLEIIFKGVLYIPADVTDGYELAGGELLEVYTINTD